MSKLREYLDSDQTTNHILHNIAISMYHEYIEQTSSWLEEKRELISDEYDLFELPPFRGLEKVSLKEKDSITLYYCWVESYHNRGDYNDASYLIPDSLISAYENGTEAFQNELTKYISTLIQEYDGYYDSIMEEKHEDYQRQKRIKEQEERALLKKLKEKYGE